MISLVSVVQGLVYINIKEQLFFSFVLSLCCNSAMKEKWWSSWLLKLDSVDQVVQWLAKSSGFRSSLENANNSAQSLFLRLWSCCAIREMKRWQWEEQRSGIRFITGADCSALVFRGELQEERWAWGGHAKGGPDSNSFSLKIWSEGFRTYSLFILSHLSGLQR